MERQYNIDGRDLWLTYGVALLRGAASELVSYPCPKPLVTHNFDDADGEEVLTHDGRVHIPYYVEARDISLECLLAARNEEDFWSKYKRFYEYLKKEFYLYSWELNKAFKVRLVEYGKARKWGSIRNDDRIVMKFTIKLRASNPALKIVNGIVDEYLNLVLTDNDDFMAVED